MKIEGSIKVVQNLNGGDSRPRAQPAPSPQKGPEPKIELSALSSSLAKAESSLATTPAVNRARVDEIRAAISEGRFKVNSERVADSLIESVQEMLVRQRGE